MQIGNNLPKWRFWQGVKSCVSEIRQSQGCRCGNSADSGLKPLITVRPSGQGGMHALGVNAGLPGGTL